MSMFNNVLHNTLAQVSARARHFICMVIHVVRLSVLWLSVLHFVLFRVFLLSFLLPRGHWFVFLLPCGRHQGNWPVAFRQLRSPAFWPKTLLSQVMSPSSLTISATRRLLKSSSGTNPATRCLRTCMTRRSVTTPSAERSLHHCSFRSEKNQRTVDKLMTLLKNVCCQLSFFLCVTQERGDPCTKWVRWVRAAEKNSVATQKNERIRILFERQKERILVDYRAEIQKHEFQADSDRRSIQELSGIIESQRREIDLVLAGDEQLRRDQQLLHEQLSEQNRDLREVHVRRFNEMEELKRI